MDAAALAAADGHLSIAVVLVAAFRGHKIGRAVAYQLGARGGRPLMERPGWFEGVRLRDLIGRIAVVEGVLFVALLAAVLLLYRYGRRRLFRAGPADSRGKADGPRASGFTK